VSLGPSVAGHQLSAARLKLFLAEQAAAGALLMGVVAASGQPAWVAFAVAVGATLWLQGTLYLADLYQRAAMRSPRRWAVAAGAGAAGLSVLMPSAGASPLRLPLGVLAALIALLLLRSAVLHRPWRVVLLGGGAAIPACDEVAQLHPEEASLLGLLPLGESPVVAPGISRLPLIFSRPGEESRALVQAGAEWLVVPDRAAVDPWLLATAARAGLRLMTPAQFCLAVGRRLPGPLVDVEVLASGAGLRASRREAALRRLMDVTAAATLLLLAAPVLLLAMALVRLDAPGPVFYRQDRVGLDGRTFGVVKLRTMRVDAERPGEAVWAQAGDPRVTRVGRWLRLSRVDELPQLWSVLRGEMSLVGPRPERPAFVAMLEQQLPGYRLRSLVKPGLTGWAQLCHPYGASVEDARHKLAYDLYYLTRRSLLLDGLILLHTVRTVLTGRGAR